MKKSMKCLKCGCEELFHSPSVLDRGSANLAFRMAVERLESPDPAAGDGGDVHHVGEFEVYVCTDCGYSEFFVKDPKKLVASHTAQAQGKA